MSKRTKIILVDDHNIVRQGIKLILEGETGFEVVGEASDANEATTKTNELRPDVVVMDIHLAATDGVEASRRIIATHPGTKIVVLSAETAPEIVNRALQSGVSGYVLKEAAGEELIRAIHTVLSGRFYLCPTITTTLIRSRSFDAQADTTPTLSEREKELIGFIASGLRNKEIAEKLNLSIKSIEANRSRLMTKIGCSSVADLVRYALREGLAKP
jgi:two-component system, NarL family, response regulator NreC